MTTGNAIEYGFLWSPGLGGNFLASLIHKEGEHIGSNEYKSRDLKYGSHHLVGWDKVAKQYNFHTIAIVPDEYDIMMGYLLAKIKQQVNSGQVHLLKQPNHLETLQKLYLGEHYEFIKSQWMHFIKCKFRQFNDIDHTLYSYKELVTQCKLQGTIFEGHEAAMRDYHNSNMDLWTKAGLKPEYNYL